TCMLMGRYEDALAAADQICDSLTPDVLGVEGVPQMVATLESYYAMRMHVLTRFGRWEDIVAAPMPVDPELYLVSTAMHHYAKGIAHATLKQFDAADVQLDAFYRSVERVPESRKFFNNTALNVLAVGEAMLLGELAYHKGEYERAFDHLREAVQRDDDLEYTEPWAWMHPPRHALAALLSEQGQYEEAEALYRADLGMDASLQRCAQHPENVWSLLGLVECLRVRGDSIELPELERRLAVAQEHTDVEITSSCMCRGHGEGDTPIVFLGRRDRP
ncbi:MAG: tetratricopeptide repeat protein, partial [Acidimicrobiia bacterium]|nr:tetratricopeptide repeat protein [Acidimicrobiia bacterium]